mmetsp:Transcript_17947/g.16225  ORF Transcript_17947/g.16225 Transcript_17947/m.16225 type:complete len:224 (+) Transcript_17947:89-760(+)
MSKLFGKVLKETGVVLNEVGLTIANEDHLRRVVSNHRPILNLFEKRPVISIGTFVAPNASVVGSVTLAVKSSVWYGAVVRGDVGNITIGNISNIQDNAVILTIPTSSALDDPTIGSDVTIGDSVTVGHGAIIKSSIIHNNVLIGQGAVIQEGSIINDDAIIAAGAVLLPNTFVKKGELFAGNPAVFIRQVTIDEIKANKTIAEEYANRANEHAEELRPYNADV